ncbi:hypothetical protein OG889_42655 [Streptomyces sp. NBC_00481]|nr:MULTISPECIES: hypothetical protein [unclassified Streptomyces]WRZ00800.1 hypothetical protein OG889_42655 [Streptomyces sp. NBC_00481]
MATTADLTGEVTASGSDRALDIASIFSASACYSSLAVIGGDRR